MKLKAAGRNLLMGIGLLLVTSAGVSIWSLERVSQLATDAASESAKIDHLLMTAARVQTDFQVQIQEFKNILLAAKTSSCSRNITRHSSSAGIPCSPGWMRFLRPWITQAWTRVQPKNCCWPTRSSASAMVKQPS